MAFLKQLFTAIFIAHVAIANHFHLQANQQSFFQIFKNGFTTYSEPMSYSLMGVGLGLMAFGFHKNFQKKSSGLANAKLRLNLNNDLSAANVHATLSQNAATNNNNVIADQAQQATNLLKKTNRERYLFAAGTVLLAGLSGFCFKKSLDAFFSAQTGK